MLDLPIFSANNANERQISAILRIQSGPPDSLLLSGRTFWRRKTFPDPWRVLAKLGALELTTTFMRLISTKLVYPWL